jgi:hypothetical protein
MRTAVWLALAAALVVSGCGGGGSGKSEANVYAKAVTKAQVDLAATLTKAQGQTGTSARSAAQQAGAIKAAIDQDVATLQRVKPPDKVAALHKQLITEFHQLAGGMGDMAAAFAANDRKKLADARAKVVLELANVGAQIQRTVAAINKKLRG